MILNLVVQKIVESPLIWVAAPNYATEFQLHHEHKNLTPHLRFCERRYASDKLIVKTSQGKTTYQYFRFDECE